ncbi:hypothetical protein KUCAC02_029681, partial [Chaenocephalus aceratus]
VKTFCVSHSLERILCASCPPGHRELCGFPQFTSEISSCRPLPTSEEDLCPICYAHSISAVFRPCSHKSCKACINQHLMNNKDCFFCKATITG